MELELPSYTISNYKPDFIGFDDRKDTYTIEFDDDVGNLIPLLDSLCNSSAHSPRCFHLSVSYINLMQVLGKGFPSTTQAQPSCLSLGYGKCYRLKVINKEEAP